jgi:RNA polymerase sigma factor (sigma-70 family)
MIVMQSHKLLSTERELIERAIKDTSAFGVIFDIHYSTILNYIVRRTGNIALSKDIASEVFMKAMDALPKYQWRGVPLSAWLYRIAGNELRMHYRKYGRLTSLDELQENTGFEPISDIDISEELQSAQDTVDRHAQAQLARQLINQLPERYREVIALRFAEQKKIKEIAEIIGKSEGTVKSLLSRALARLRKAMSQNKSQPFANTRIVDSEGRDTSKAAKL